MAIRGTIDDPTAAPIFAPEQTHAPGPSASPHQRTPDNDFFSVLRTANSGQALGPDIEKYIENVKAYFPKDGTPITVKRLTQPQGAHAFISGGHCIIILFDELLSHDVQNLIPASDAGSIASEALKREITPTPALLHVQLVIPADYSRAHQMARYILLSFMFSGTSNFANSTVELLSKVQFGVDPNVEAARAFIDQRSPHSVPERGDTGIGFVVYAKSPRDFGNPSPQNDEVVPFAAVLGYVDVWRQGGELGSYDLPNQKFQATVHITNITSDIAHPGIIPLCLAIAADRFIEQRRWLTPFMNFQRKARNLGNLTIDKEKKTLWFAEDVRSLYEWLGNNMFPVPFLALDVLEGRARIPATALYGDTIYTNRVFDQITRFFGNIPLDRTSAPFIPTTQSFVGTYGDPKGVLTDSREIDYLKLLADYGALDQSSQILLYPNSDAVQRAKVVSDRTAGTFRSLYRNTPSILNPSLLALIAGEIRSRLKFIGEDRNNLYAATPWVTGLQKQYLESTFNTAGQNTHKNGYSYTRPDYGIG